MNETEGTEHMETKDGYDADTQTLTPARGQLHRQGLHAGGLDVTFQ